MRRFMVVAAVLAATCLVAVPVSAQQRQGRMGGGFAPSGIMLLGQKSVQEELKMSEDQVAKVTEESKKGQEARRGLRDLSPEERTKKMAELRAEGDKAVATILKPEQAKRLNEIVLQQTGPGAVLKPEIAKELKITDDQKKSIAIIQEDNGKEMAKLFQPGGNQDENRKKAAELRKAANEQILKVLTDEQQAKWKTLQGEPFKGEITFGGPRRPRN